MTDTLFPTTPSQEEQLLCSLAEKVKIITDRANPEGVEYNLGTNILELNSWVHNRLKEILDPYFASRGIPPLFFSIKFCGFAHPLLPPKTVAVPDTEQVVFALEVELPPIAHLHPEHLPKMEVLRNALTNSVILINPHEHYEGMPNATLEFRVSTNKKNGYTTLKQELTNRFERLINEDPRPQRLGFRVAFSGTSGSGKTTMLKALQEMCPKMEHLVGSAGTIKSEEDKKILNEKYSYPGGGHLAVIKHSALNVDYGIENQAMILRGRRELFSSHNNFLTDRSPIDNCAYYATQVSWQSTEDQTLEHIAKALVAATELTHIIYVKAVQPFEMGIETNGRRVDNQMYQKMVVDPTFQMFYDLFKEILTPWVNFYQIDYWDYQKRLAFIEEIARGFNGYIFPKPIDVLGKGSDYYGKA